MFYSFKNNICNVQHVGGSGIFASGFGIIFIKLKKSNIIIPLYPVYYMPKNPQNTLSTGALKHYNGFKHIIVSSSEYVLMIHKWEGD